MSELKPIKLKVPNREETLKKNPLEYTEVEKMLECLPYVASMLQILYK